MLHKKLKKSVELDDYFFVYYHVEIIVNKNLFITHYLGSTVDNPYTFFYKNKKPFASKTLHEGFIILRENYYGI